MKIDDGLTKNRPHEKSKGDAFATKSVELLEKLSDCITLENLTSVQNALGFALSRIDDPTGQSYEYWLYNAGLVLESLSKDSGPCSGWIRECLVDLISQVEDKLYAQLDCIQRKQLAKMCLKEWPLIERIGIQRVTQKELLEFEVALDRDTIEDRLSLLESGGIINIFTLDEDEIEYIQLSSKGLRILSDPVSMYGPARIRSNTTVPKLDGGAFGARRQIAAEFGDEIALDRRNYESPADVRKFQDNFDLALISATCEK